MIVERVFDGQLVAGSPVSAPADRRGALDQHLRAGAHPATDC
jgi:hypothetical protein